MSVWSVVFSCVCQSCFARSTEQQFRRCCHVGVQKCRPFYVRSVEPVVKVDGHRSQSVGWIEVVRAICLFFLFKSLTIHLSIYVFLHSTRCVRTRMGKLANNGHAGQLPRAKVSGWSATLTSSSRRAVVRSDRSRDLHLGKVAEKHSQIYLSFSSPFGHRRSVAFHLHFVKVAKVIKVVVQCAQLFCCCHHLLGIFIWQTIALLSPLL
ncbi:Ephrin type-A receptor 4-A [Trichinella nativa]|uniref:Ephrin type-A receptor 4-A n=1 Tax=Trichinella nativa TaxID=6335 RepID=A0A0V1LF26_9BILA|nr:Ephrin type-A receptor 4-A [Trichinella nativa]